MFTITEILDLAIQIEKNGERDYRTAGEKTSDPGLCSLFAWLADDEKKHADWFKDLKTRLSIAPMDEEIAQMARQLLSDILGDQSFSLGDVDFTRIDSVKKGIGVAIGFEEDTALFYETLKAFVPDPRDQAHLDEVIAEENRHIEVLKVFLETGELP